MQVGVVGVVGQFLELTPLDLLQNVRDQVVLHVQVHHDVQLKLLSVVAPEADPGEAEDAEEEQERDSNRKLCQSVHRPDHQQQAHVAEQKDRLLDPNRALFSHELPDQEAHRVLGKDEVAAEVRHDAEDLLFARGALLRQRVDHELSLVPPVRVHD